MRLRESSKRMRRLQLQLRRTGHLPADPYYKAMLEKYWDGIRTDRRIVKGEL